MLIENDKYNTMMCGHNVLKQLLFKKKQSHAILVTLRPLVPYMRQHTTVFTSNDLKIFKLLL